ncbi:hypothetical protein [Xylophilus sp. GOD-11R]|uniref:hypothetical protein n=1 Tax=Xylophilus sp. GOD-11R TaxID=3089814 RepID=UPI00298D5B39|nr:hypothetical protein [Xylophilus sp. GOD-11R]WPB58616.1 hypothetical protein R9X41_08270 [Xylophilus sp. GOD-11R]
MTTRPVPYPADTRAKGWRFELDHERIRQSDTWALAPAEVRPWLLMLWMTSWEQTPCGSLPAADELIAARVGMTPKAFAKARSVLLRGWWLGEDGRLYHDTLIARVEEMMTKRRSDSDRQAQRRARIRQESEKVAPVSRVTPTGLHGESDTGTGTGTSNTSPSLRSGEVAHAAQATPGEACKAMKQAGLQAVNPSHPQLAALLGAGITLDELTVAAAEAAEKGKPFAYALATAEGRRRDAAVAPLPAAGVRPAKAQPKSFAQQEREAGWARWEEMTGRVHPDRQAASGGRVIDITPNRNLQLEAAP